LTRFKKNLMAEKLSDRVVNRHRRCIDLRDQRGGLTASVLESLRTFLRSNDLYIHLCVSDNLLSNEALAELCALLKRHPYLASLEAQHCGLQDKDFCFYFGPALISMPQLTFVDLSRNSGLTDASAETVARILLETEVESIRLIGTSFTVAGGRVIAAAAANTTSLVHCELPYTVGNVVLDEVEVYTRRNRAHLDRLREASSQYARLQIRHYRLPSLPGLSRVEASQALIAGSAATLERDSSSSLALTPVASGSARAKSVSHTPLDAFGQTSEDRQWRACISKGRRRTLVQPEPVTTTTMAAAVTAAPMESSVTRELQTPFLSSTTSATTLSTPATASFAARKAPSSFPLTPPPSTTRRTQGTPNSLDTVTMWDWADPAMSNALRCLFVLDHQSQLLDQYRAAAAPPGVVVPESARRTRTRSKGRTQSSARRWSSGGGTTDSVSLPPL
jgi:hypothetical protein